MPTELDENLVARVERARRPDRLQENAQHKGGGGGRIAAGESFARSASATFERRPPYYAR